MIEKSLPQTAGVEYRFVVGFPAYAVGDDSSVWSRRPKGNGLNRRRTGPWKRLKGCINVHGYPQVRLSKDGKTVTCLVHMLLLKAFVGPMPPKHETRHLNGNRQDNRLANLCWGTPKENGKDKVRHGNSGKGRTHWRPGAKLTEEQVRSIRKRYKEGETQIAIAADYPTHQTNVSRIVNRKIWSHVES